MLQIDYEHLWDFFQREDAFEDENRIWLDGYYYLGALDIGDKPRIEVSGSDDIIYCTSKEDLPRIVSEFIALGSSLGSVLRGCRQYEQDGRLSSKEEKLQVLANANELSFDDQKLVAFSKAILDIEVAIAFFKRRDISEEIIEILTLDNDLVDFKELIAISPSSTPKTSQMILESLEEYPDPEVEFAIRTKDVLPDSFKFQTISKKVEAIGSGLLDAHLLRVLVESPNTEIRISIALLEDLPQDILAILQDDQDDSVRSAIQERALPSAIRSLSHSEKVDLVSENSLSDDILEMLGRIPERDLRIAVALNASEGSSILQLLKHDEDDFVSYAANTERYLPISVRPSQFDFWSLEDEARSLDIAELSEGDISGIVRYPNSSFALGLSKRGDLPKAAQVELSCHSDDEVRRAIAKSLFTGRDVLLNMLNDEEDFIRDLAQENLDFIDCPEEWREMDTWQRTVRIAEDESLPNELLNIFSMASYFRVREAVAKNRLVPKEVLIRLLTDDSEEVRVSAQKSLDSRFA